VLLAEEGRVYLGTVPSKKRVQRICRAISDETGRDKVWQDSKTIVERLNRVMIGWAKDCRRRAIDVVVVWKFDRFARSLNLLIAASNSAERSGSTLYG